MGIKSETSNQSLASELHMYKRNKGFAVRIMLRACEFSIVRQNVKGSENQMHQSRMGLFYRWHVYRISEFDLSRASSLS